MKSAGSGLSPAFSALSVLRVCFRNSGEIRWGIGEMKDEIPERERGKVS